jgi:hypothetical protein
MGGTKMSKTGFLPSKNSWAPRGNKYITSNHNTAEVQKRLVRKK